MCAHCVGIENVDQAAGRIIAAEYRKLERENLQMLDALKGVLGAWGGHMRDDDCGCADCEYLRPVVAAIAAASRHNAGVLAHADENLPNQ
jgi:hypothetical protein